MKGELTVEEKKKGTVLPARTLWQRPAVQPVADHAVHAEPASAMPGCRFTQDLSQMPMRKAADGLSLSPQAGAGVPAIVHEVLHSPGQPLDANTRAFMEPRFCHDFSHVPTHSGCGAMRSELAPSSPWKPPLYPSGATCHTRPVEARTKLTINQPGDKYEQEAGRVSEQVMREPPLDPNKQAFMESGTGHDFSRVRVHTDALANISAQALHASAYTVGNDIVFASGAYTPSTIGGRRLLAHELAHVIQQSDNGKRIQRWGDAIHREITETASDVITDEDVGHIAAGKAEFVAKLKPYSISTDYKARRLLYTGPLFLSGAVEGEGPDHGEDGNYSSTNPEMAREQNVNKQQGYIAESVGYYRQLMSSARRGETTDQGGPAIDRSDAWDVLSLPGLGAASGAVAGTLYGVGAAKLASEAVGGGFWGGLLGTLVGLATVPFGLAAGAAAGALGIGAAVSAGKSRPATNARDGVFAALGDACHVAQDRGAHWEGVKGFGHTDPRCQQIGWNPDNKNDNPGSNAGDFGGFNVAVRNTRKVFTDWISLIRESQRGESPLKAGRGLNESSGHDGKRTNYAKKFGNR